MKNGLQYKRQNWFVVIACFVCWSVNADLQTSAVEHSNEWQVEYLKDGKTRFEALHGKSVHFYEIKLTGVSIDGKAIELTDPKITINNNQVTKQWLPFLKETWIDAQGYKKWSFEVTRPSDLPESAKYLILTYDVESDGVGGLTVGDQTSILFGVDPFGNQVQDSVDHEQLTKSKRYSVTLLSSRCRNAVGIAVTPVKINLWYLTLVNRNFHFILMAISLQV